MFVLLMNPSNFSQAQYPMRKEKALLPTEIKTLLEVHLASPKFSGSSPLPEIFTPKLN